MALVRWPAEQDRRQELAAAGHPRLLLVEPGAPPPVCADELEDWVRLPAPDTDVRARAEALARRAAARGLRTPVVDADGVLRYRGRSVPLPPVEARLTRALVDRYGAVVSRAQLARAGWPGADPGRNALDVHVMRLRRRLAPVGLVIRTVRGRGYLLTAGD